MTEAEWLACEDPLRLTIYLNSRRARASERKVRLLACACCARAERFLDNAKSREALLVAERFADGLATDTELSSAHHSAEQGLRGEGGIHRFVATAVREATKQQFSLRDVFAWAPPAKQLSPDAQERSLRDQISLIRDIFGNPFRPVVFSPVWRTDTAVAVARQMYESRDFGAMPILADAIQDAGCEDEHILNHCRDTTATHVRGCWVVDLVLGKE